MSPSPVRPGSEHEDDTIPVLTERLGLPPLDFDTTIPIVPGFDEEDALQEVIPPDVELAPLPSSPLPSPLPSPPPPTAPAAGPPPVFSTEVPAPDSKPGAAASPSGFVQDGEIAYSPGGLPEDIAREVAARVRARLEPEMDRILSVFAAFAREALEDELHRVLGEGGSREERKQ